MASLLCWVLDWLYQVAPMAIDLPWLVGQSRAVGWAVGAGAFLLANLFALVPATVLPMLVVPSDRLVKVEPLETTQILPKFMVLGLRISKILPEDFNSDMSGSESLVAPVESTDSTSGGIQVSAVSITDEHESEGFHSPATVPDVDSDSQVPEAAANLLASQAASADFSAASESPSKASKIPLQSDSSSDAAIDKAQLIETSAHISETSSPLAEAEVSIEASMTHQVSQKQMSQVVDDAEDAVTSNEELLSSQTQEITTSHTEEVAEAMAVDAADESELNIASTDSSSIAEQSEELHSVQSGISSK